MKITRRQLRQVIKEEIEPYLLKENPALFFFGGLAGGLATASRMGSTSGFWARDLTDEERGRAYHNTRNAFVAATLKAISRAVKRAKNEKKITEKLAVRIIRYLTPEVLEMMTFGKVEPSWNQKNSLMIALGIINKSDIEYAKSSLGVKGETLTGEHGDVSLVDYEWVKKNLDKMLTLQGWRD